MKLYVKSVCYVCNNKTYNCHSCSNGYVFIEASDKTVCEWFKNIDEQQKNLFISALQDSVDYI
jgi:hypothetical protein